MTELALADALAVDVNIWAARITESWRTTVDAVLNVGRLLIDAKQALPHGQFEAMIESNLPFKPHTAQRLMAIARDQRILTHSALVPPSWSTLYEITKLTDDEFKNAVALNLIRSDTERWEIDGYRKRLAQEIPQTPTPAKWAPSLGARDPRLWTIAQLRVNAKRLQVLLEQTGAASELSTVGEIVSDQKLKKVWGK